MYRVKRTAFKTTINILPLSETLNIIQINHKKCFKNHV